jgi:hypothetical protein
MLLSLSLGLSHSLGMHVCSLRLMCLLGTLLRHKLLPERV